MLLRLLGCNRRTYSYFKHSPASSTTSPSLPLPLSSSRRINFRTILPSRKPRIYPRIFQRPLTGGSFPKRNYTRAITAVVGACSRARRTRTRCYVRGGEPRRHTGAKREMRMNVIIYLIFVGSLPLFHSRYYKSTNILALAFFLSSSRLSPFLLVPIHPLAFHSFLGDFAKVHYFILCKRYTMGQLRFAGETLIANRSGARIPVVCIRGPAANGSQGTLGSITVGTSWNLK